MINEPTMKNLILIISVLIVGARATTPTVESVAGTYICDTSKSFPDLAAVLEGFELTVLT